MTKNTSLLNCLYNVYLASGMVRLTGREAIARVGWNDFQSEYVDHSEWCEMPDCVAARKAAVPAGIWLDPFLAADAGEPPF